MNRFFSSSPQGEKPRAVLHLADQAVRPPCLQEERGPERPPRGLARPLPGPGEPALHGQPGPQERGQYLNRPQASLTSEQRPNLLVLLPRSSPPVPCRPSRGPQGRTGSPGTGGPLLSPPSKGSTTRSRPGSSRLMTRTPPPRVRPRSASLGLQYSSLTFYCLGLTC